MKKMIKSMLAKWKSILRHPVVSFKSYVADFKAQNTKGKIVKILKTIGFFVGSFFAVKIGFTLLALFILLSVVLGSVGSRKGSYYAYEMMNGAENEEEREYWEREYRGY